MKSKIVSSLLGFATLVSTVAAFAQPNSPGLVWEHLSGVEAWVPHNVSFSNEGTQSIISLGPYSDYTRVFSSYSPNPPTPIFQYMHPSITTRHFTAGSKSKDLQAAIFDVARGQGVYDVILKVVSLSNPAANWTYNWPVATNGHDKLDVKISNDGSRIVAIVANINTFQLDVKVFSPTSSVPVSSFPVNLATFNAVRLSGDGTRLAVNGGVYLKVINAFTGQELLSSLQFSPMYNSLGISGDGKIVALGFDGSVKIYKQNATNQQYSLVHTHTLAGPNYCQRLAISDDGSTMVMGFTFFDTYRKIQIRAIELSNYNLLMDDIVTTLGSAFRNAVSDISVSASGKRFAVGTWGDENGVAPELRIYSRDQNAPIRAVDLLGSILALDMSADGRRVAVASKDHHLNSVLAGGRVQIFEAAPLDITIQGVPRAGSTISVTLRGQPGRTAQLLFANSLAQNPTDFGNIGTLYLSRTALNIVPAGVFDSTGEAHVQFNVPSNVGDEMYFQAYSNNPRRLGSDWAKITAIP